MRFEKYGGWAERGSRRRRWGHAVAAIVGVMAASSAVSRADVTTVTQTGGPPQLPIPTFQETGLPNYTMPVGTPSLPPAITPGSTPGSGTGGQGGSGGGTSADAVLEQRSWGALASQNVTTIGVNPSVIAATCVIESGCQNVNARSGSSVSGAFQMTDPTYNSDIRQAAAQNPSLAGTIDTSQAGKLDPANQAIAAAQDMKNAATSLQQAGVPNPTFLDTRGYYQFGAGPGPQIARSLDSRSMSDILSTYYTPAQLAANSITPSTTVGQWRQSIIDKVGSAANQQVLL